MMNNECCMDGWMIICALSFHLPFFATETRLSEETFVSPVKLQHKHLLFIDPSSFFMVEKLFHLQSFMVEASQTDIKASWSKRGTANGQCPKNFSAPFQGGSGFGLR